ncbi:putative porin [Sediminibacter sp. Hel_I_10]|uniref:putative porin n=1 Tax=Sediminibacter sp. Hel_I_10 TaxID=1392490 RepID=UPI00047D3F90|nr:putative porin [Sediminibacter sp. Hel_I_10]
MRNFSLFILIAFSHIAFGQVLERSDGTGKSKSKSDSTINKKEKSSPKDSISIFDYKIITSQRDTIYVDTSLTIQKEYKFNYLRRDEFGLIPFANVGQTYNSLKPRSLTSGILPNFGARARHYNYLEEGDINYYHVPTPLTELFFKTVFEQGQVLDAFFTVNTSKQFNMSIAYKGLRSLGNYQHTLTSTGNLRITSNYTSKNNRYQLRAHITFQDLLNEENGGLTAEGVANFTSGNEDFLDRAVFDPKFDNAQSILDGRRFYLDQSYAVTSPNDSLANSIKIKATVSFEDKDFQFDQTAQYNDLFGPAFSNRIRDKVSLQDFNSRLGAELKNDLGEFSFGGSYSNFNYGYDFATILNDQVILNRIVGNTVGLYGGYKKTINRLKFQANLETIVTGDFDGYRFNGGVSYILNETTYVKADMDFKSTAANYNLLLNQSRYLNYNWYNRDRFENENLNQLKFELHSEKLFNASLVYNTIDNYSFFGYSETLEGVKPFQANDPVSYYGITIDKEIKVGKFALDNKLLYQKVVKGEGVLNVPDFVIRNSLYYSNAFFKNNALSLQTGFIFNYFSNYFADGYDPLLAEFYTQNSVEIGNFPRLDFFLNAKVRQTRIYLKAEHLNAAITGYNYFSAPDYPYRDFNIRFGLVWNFFL